MPRSRAARYACQNYPAQTSVQAHRPTLLGVQTRRIDTLRKIFGSKAERSDGRLVRINAPEWLRIWARYTSGVLEDGEEQDESSPWLEEKRKWQALRERAKYEQESAVLMPVDDVNEIFRIVGSHIRQASVHSCERCQGLLEDALDDAERVMDDIAKEADAERPSDEPS